MAHPGVNLSHGALRGATDTREAVIGSGVLAGILTECVEELFRPGGFW